MTSNFAELVADVEPLGLVSDFADEFAEVVHTQPIFADFTSLEITLMCEYLECFGVSRDTTILREGDRGDFLVILVTGQALICKNHEGRRVELHQLKPGEMIGEMSLIDGQQRFASCVSTEPSDLAILSKQGFDRMIRDDATLANKLLLMLLRLSTQRLRRATAYMVTGLMDESA